MEFDWLFVTLSIDVVRILYMEFEIEILLGPTGTNVLGMPSYGKERG